MFRIFWRWKIRSFLSQKVGRNMIFTDYWKVLILNFSGMRNMVFFFSQKVDGKMIFSDNWKDLVLHFSVMGNTFSFSVKSWWKDYIYLVYLSLLWYSRTWEIWLFVQCLYHFADKIESLPCIGEIERFYIIFSGHTPDKIVSAWLISSKFIW